MYYVCTNEYGTILRLGEFETEEEAKEFMKHNCILFDADETEDGCEVIIKPEYMFIVGEEEAFSMDEPFDPCLRDWADDLPF